MSGKLSVGNLPASATKTGLQAKFEQFGRVISVSIEAGGTSRFSKRSAQVEMDSEGAAQAAIDRLNMTQYEDAIIAVYRARVDANA